MTENKQTSRERLDVLLGMYVPHGAGYANAIAAMAAAVTEFEAAVRADVRDPRDLSAETRTKLDRLVEVHAPPVSNVARQIAIDAMTLALLEFQQRTIDDEVQVMAAEDAARAAQAAQDARNTAKPEPVAPVPTDPATIPPPPEVVATGDGAGVLPGTEGNADGGSIPMPAAPVVDPATVPSATPGASSGRRRRS